MILLTQSAYDVFRHGFFSLYLIAPSYGYEFMLAHYGATSTKAKKNGRKI